MRGARQAALVAVVLLQALLAGCERTPTEQRGFRGLGVMQVGAAQTTALQADINTVPAALRRPAAGGTKAGDEYSNVQVLGDLNKAEFARLMLSFKTWIAPEEGCGYCHNVPDYASDEKPTKRTARAMIRMTRAINTRWTTHVKSTGVTCYTCHRGQAIPPRVWFSGTQHAGGVLAGRRSVVDLPTPTASRTASPNDALDTLLVGDHRVALASGEPLRTDNTALIPDARTTYALMMVMSESLGVNCTFCHNSRSFYAWAESPPQRVTAWYGIRMARELNRDHLAGLAGLLQPEQLGPAGDGPKIYCATCHVGLSRPLNGVNMVKDFPELIGTRAELAAAQTLPAAPPLPTAPALATATAKRP